MKFRNLLFGATVLAGSIGTANAVPAFWNDTYDPADIKISAPGSYPVPLDITGGSNGFRPGLDTVDGALLTIRIYDGEFDNPETVNFNFDGQNWGSSSVPLFGLLPFAFSNIDSLLSDGLLNIVVTATQGDFYFDSASLLAWGDRSTNVPEPATLALFGLGLVGLGLVGRRRRR
jgi:hypothetical protein